MMMTAKRLSETRREIATLIEAGRVRYELPEWLIDGQEVGGWQGRALREMERDAQIRVAEDGTVSITDEVRTLLAEDDTDE
jgi:hypothetical protein